MVKKWKKKYAKGGKLNGPSHSKGGININVEGGEFVVKKGSVNKKTERVLKYINNNGKLPPTFDSRKRRK